MKQLYIHILTILLLFNTVKAEDISNDLSDKKVLLLNSYHKGFKWTDDIVSGVEDVLAPYNVQLSIEYMDTKNHFDDEFIQALIEFLNIKYKRDTFDLIIASNDYAFDFIYHHREGIFKDVPIVFCGVNYFDKSKYAKLNNYTGVSEIADIETNLKFICNTHPDCNKIVAIIDGTYTGANVYKELENISNKDIYSDFEVWYNFEEAQLVDSLQSLQSNDVVLLTLLFRDALGKTYEYDKSTRLVTQHTSAPVYGTWDFCLGYGIIGGYLVNGYAHGIDAAQMSLKVLSGIPADSIPVNYATTHNYMFDYNKIKSYNIDASIIPESSQVLNKPISVFQKYKRIFIFISIVIFLLIVFIVILAIGLKRTKRIKKQVEFKQLRLESIISNIPGTVFQVDALNDWKVAFMSENIESICGLKADSFINAQLNVFNSFICKDDIEQVIESRNKNINDDGYWRTQYKLVVDDKIKWIYEAGRYIKDSSGKVLTMEGILFDITKEKNIENKLVESKERYKSLSDELHLIINNIPGLVFYKDTENRFKYVNKFMAESAGLKREELINRKVSDFYNPELAELYFKDDTEVMNSRIPKLNYEEPWEWDGQKGWFLSSKIPHVDHTGKVLGIIGVAIDISQQKLIEYELSNKNKQLLETKSQLIQHQNNLESLVLKRTQRVHELNDLLIGSNAELNATNDDLLIKTQELEQTIDTLKQTQQQLVQSEKMASLGILTAGIAHEINNPINFINSGLTGLEMSLNDILEGIRKDIEEGSCKNCNENTAEIMDYIPELIKSMRNGVSRTTEIVRGLRTFSRLDSETKVDADIHEIIKSTLVILKNKTKNRIEIKEQYGDIPRLNCYAGKLGQVFLNLLINAIDAIEDKGEITIRTYSDNSDNACISITDSGKGIDPDLQNKIFDPFFTTKDVGKGTGLGLAIVHGIIKEHEGSISLNMSKPNATEFLIKLPIK